VSFVTALALAVAVAAVAPLIAHLLQRGRTREQEFPAAVLVPATQSTSQERRRLEDRGLLIIRIAMILGLAVLGATPLVRCDRLALSRQTGGSVAFALVVDDSMSMRATLDNERSRWDTAVDGARALLASAREGDAVALVLAGRPARLALAATTDLSAASDALDQLEPSDRSTDLTTALQLARASIRSLPQTDKRVVVLSDLADAPVAAGSPPVWTPLPALAAPRPDCALLEAVAESRQVRVSVACQPSEAATDRHVTLVVDGTVADQSDEEIGRAALPASAGERTVVIEHEATSKPLAVVLDGSDAIQADDRLPVVKHAGGLAVGIVADRTLAAAATGGPTVLEQALAALDPPPRQRPFPLVPRDAAELDRVSLLVVDDPPGFSPEARRALGEWVSGGGIAVALLGPRAASAQLASTLEPFARGGVRWEPSQKLGVRAASVPWLGEEAGSLAELTRKGRARLDAAILEGAEVVGRWDDDAPFALERPEGRGLLLTIGLPASVEESDLALRPGFIALLDYVVMRARQRSAAAMTPVGTPWTFGEDEKVRIDGPDGPVAVTAAADAHTRVATPTLIGRYRVIRGGRTDVRVALPEAIEVLTEPQAPSKRTIASTAGTTAGRVDVSREIALLLLVLLVVELGIRVLRRREQRPSPAHETAA
jgi:hypothetical protein